MIPSCVSSLADGCSLTERRCSFLSLLFVEINGLSRDEGEIELDSSLVVHGRPTSTDSNQAAVLLSPMVDGGSSDDRRISVVSLLVVVINGLPTVSVQMLYNELAFDISVSFPSFVPCLKDRDSTRPGSELNATPPVRLLFLLCRLSSTYMSPNGTMK